MIRKFVGSFVYAAKGIHTAVLEERNFRFHLCAAVYVFVFSLFYDFGATEYLVLTLLVAGVLALELANSAIERIVDHLCPQQSKVAGAVKDIGAAAVLIFCLAAVVCGVLLFWDVVVFRSIYVYFTSHIGIFVLFVLSIIISFWFVFIFRKNQD